jgi:hypothetical protein
MGGLANGLNGVGAINILMILSAGAMIGNSGPGDRPVEAGWATSEGQSCSIYRTKDDRFTFLAATSPREWMIRVHDRKWKFPAKQPLSFKVETAHSFRFVEGNRAKTSNGWQGVVASLEPELVKAAAGNKNIMIQAGSGLLTNVDLDGLNEKMNAFQTCAARLPPAMPPEQRVVKSAVLVSDLSIRASEIGLTMPAQKELRFRLNINEEGMATSCQIVQPSGSLAFDARICALLKQRARFRPARNGSGNPVPTTFQSSVRF